MDCLLTERHGRGEEFLEAVAEEMHSRADDLVEREKALADCVEKLRDRDRELINRRYAPGVTVNDIAEQLDRPVKSIYAALTRIRRGLLKCVERALVAEGRV